MDVLISWMKLEEGNIIGSSNVYGEMFLCKLIRGFLSFLSIINFVVVDRGVLFNRNNWDNFFVKLEVFELLIVVVVVGSVYYLLIYDFMKFFFGKDVFDCIFMDNFEIKEEKEVVI